MHRDRVKLQVREPKISREARRRVSRDSTNASVEDRPATPEGQCANENRGLTFPPRSVALHALPACQPGGQRRDFWKGSRHRVQGSGARIQRSQGRIVRGIISSVSLVGVRISAAELSRLWKFFCPAKVQPVRITIGSQRGR